MDVGEGGMVRNRQFGIGQGRSRVEAFATLTDSGVSILLTGGESPHIGGLVLSSPRKSLSGSGAGADSWIVPLPGHKDAVVAEKVADYICRTISEAVAVTAGIHIDDAKAGELDVLRENSMLLAYDIALWCLEERMRQSPCPSQGI